MHNWDCAMCGEPCPISGHDPCPKSPLGVCTRTVRCWNHDLKTYLSDTPKRGWINEVRSERRDWRPERRQPQWKAPTDWRPRWPRRDQEEPKRKVEPVAPIDPGLRDLIEGKQKASDESIRERIEKGDM